MANHDTGYKLLFSHATVVADVLRGFIKEDWVQEVDFGSLERVEGSYVTEDLRLEEVKTMLAERVMEWTREWKEEGRQEGRQEGRRESLQAFQDYLLLEISERFGVVPEAVRRQVEAVREPEELKSLGRRLRAASSLDDLQR